TLEAANRSLADNGVGVRGIIGPHPEERAQHASRRMATYSPGPSFETPAFAALRRAPQDEVGGFWRPLNPLDEAVDDALLARLVELDRELVALDRDDIAVAELDVKHAVADRIGGHSPGRFGDQLAFDRQRVRPPADRTRQLIAPRRRSWLVS